jgi:hypothetical protein
MNSTTELFPLVRRERKSKRGNIRNVTASPAIIETSFQKTQESLALASQKLLAAVGATARAAAIWQFKP